MIRPTCVQYGCGLSAPDTWKNFDASPILRLQRLPLIGRFVPSGMYGRFPANALYGDIVRGLPLNENSVDFLYCSHVLEHLALNDMRAALVNSFVLLKRSGVFRLVLPDLKQLVTEYLSSTESGACIALMRASGLGHESRQRGLKAVLRERLGNSSHLWMWDFESISDELVRAGFVNVRRAEFCDSALDVFKEVEEESRWNGQLGVQCEKQ